MNLQQPPTFALPILIDEQTKVAQFNPIWLKWFLDLIEVLNAAGGTSLSINIGQASPVLSMGGTDDAGEDSLTVPGPRGETGSTGSAGPAVFLVAESGEGGEPGSPAAVPFPAWFLPFAAAHG